jgi:hypothetical protein
LSKLLEELNRINLYTQTYKYACERMTEVENIEDLRIHFIESNADPLRYNAPSKPDEIALIMVGDGETGSHSQEWVADSRSSGYRRFDDRHPSYLLLRFVLFYLYGEQGWKPNIMQTQHNANILEVEVNKIVHPDHDSRRVTQAMFFSYYIHHRIGSLANLQRGRNLYHEWLVDAYAQVEANRLRWLEMNQAKIRTELYSGIMDAIAQGDSEDANEIGK